MPELPEVETVARHLRPLLLEKTLLGITVSDSRLGVLQARGVVRDVYRVGKQVVIEFVESSKPDARRFVVIHLRMSGRLLWVGEAFLPRQAKKAFGAYADEFSIAREAHLRARFRFSDGEVGFVDPRRFGTVEIFSSPQDFAPKGVEPLTSSFTKKFLSAQILKKTQPIKQFLLRQDVIVGIGNIYASEILFDAGISPMRETKSLASSEVALIVSSTKKILRRAIRHCGTTFSDFQTTNGEVGQFAKYLSVYGREGLSCKRCKEVIISCKQGGRSTFYCEACQV